MSEHSEQPASPDPAGETDERPVDGEPAGEAAERTPKKNPAKSITLGVIVLLIVLVVLYALSDRMAPASSRGIVSANVVQASLVGLVLGPLVYFLLPARTTEQHVDKPVPTEGNVTLGAAIRATTLLGLSFWLYAVMQPSDMMMAVIAAMVLVFPTRRAVFYEARQRVRATFYGAVVALPTLWLFTLSPHLLVLLGLIFIGGLWLGCGMLSGRYPSNVYQYALSVALALIAGALSTQDAGYATFTRLVLTLGGAFAAAFLVALLDALTRWRADPCQERLDPLRRKHQSEST